MTAEIRKEIAAYSKLNLRGEGILLKKLPLTLLKQITRLEDDSNAQVSARIRNAVDRVEELQLLDAIKSWGRGGLDGSYLNELTFGLPWVKHGNLLVAYKKAGAAGFHPVGFLVYGTFQAKRNGTDDNDNHRSWVLDIQGVGNQAVNDDKIAEIEGLITAPNDPSTAGVAKALFEYAMGDLLSRTKSGNYRYDAIVLFTDNDRMKGVATPYGFSNATYKCKDPNTNANLTTSLVHDGAITSTAQNKAYVFRASQKGTTARNRMKDRVVNSDVCLPVKQSNLQYWQFCK